jgi:hypothetical protein
MIGMQHTDLSAKTVQTAGSAYRGCVRWELGDVCVPVNPIISLRTAIPSGAKAEVAQRNDYYWRSTFVGRRGCLSRGDAVDEAPQPSGQGNVEEHTQTAHKRPSCCRRKARAFPAGVVNARETKGRRTSCLFLQTTTKTQTEI